MPLRINEQSGQAATLRHAQGANDKLSEALKRMSSGRRITDAGDDPTGLSIARKLAAEAASQGTLQRGIQDGISLAQTGDAALGSVGDDVARIRELALQAGNGTASPEQRAAAQAEIDQLRDDIDRVASDTEFNGRALLNGDTGPGSGAHVATGTDGSGTSVEIEASSSSALGLDSVDVTTEAGAQAAVAAADSAADQVQSRRSALGATQNSFAHAIRQVSVAAENTEAARSRIEDADMAREVSNQVAARIQRDAATAAQSQLDQSRGSVLRLLES